MMEPLLLDGTSLSIQALVQAARSSQGILLDPASLERMKASRELIDQAVTLGKPVYGVTRGLGAKATQTLGRDELADFSEKTVRGRAHTIGDDTPSSSVRAAMIVRANTLLTGHSGARADVAKHLAACLNANITPIVKSTGSIGVADLLPNAAIGLSLMGEGMMHNGSDNSLDQSSRVMEKYGIRPLKLEARDGLALASHSSFVAALAAIALTDAQHAYATAQSAAALSIEAFRANLSALDMRALALRPLPGQMAAAQDLRKRLEGSALFDYAQARRIQDPLSIRNVPQIHGTVHSAICFATEAIEIEINGVSDNPVVLPDDQAIISCGLYFTSELCNAIDAVCRAFVHLASAQLARTSKHMDAQLSDLPAYLTQDGVSSAGLAPILKIQEALFSEIAQAAQPGPVWPSAGGGGVEDCIAGSPTAVKSLAKIAELGMRMSAVEMMVACQAFELRDPEPEAGSHIRKLVSKIQSLSPRAKQDQPLSDDIEQIHDAIAQSTLIMPLVVPPNSVFS